MTVDIRRGSARFVTREPGRETRHAFSFGEFYDPERLSFGPLVCHDEHLLRSGVGFDTHRHRDLEIVSVVVDGVLTHASADGTTVEVPAGSMALFSTGDGADHAEVAAATPTRFVQMWFTGADVEQPSYRVAVLPTGTGVLPAPLQTAVPGMRISTVTLAAGESVALPATTEATPRLHVYVARGALLRSSLAEPMQAGDAFVCAHQPSFEVTAGVPSLLVVLELP